MHYDVPPNYSTFDLSAGLRWEEFSFNLAEAKTLNTVLIYCATKTGTLAATDIQCSIWSETETSNVPLASLASTATVSGVSSGVQRIVLLPWPAPRRYRQP